MSRTFNIYCDESCHLEHDDSNVMVLGCVWCPIEKKDGIFTRLREIKVRNGIKPTCELKWNAISKAKLSYYMDVLDYFFDMSDLHFRALVVPNKQELRHAEFRQTHDQFYYKMYFDLLKTILSPQEFYNILILKTPKELRRWIDYGSIYATTYMTTINKWSNAFSKCAPMKWN